MSMKIWHEVLIHQSVQREAAQWCREQYGERWHAMDNRDGVWAMCWAGIMEQESAYMYRFRFTNESDLMVFILRWA